MTIWVAAVAFSGIVVVVENAAFWTEAKARIGPSRESKYRLTPQGELAKSLPFAVVVVPGGPEEGLSVKVGAGEANTRDGEKGRDARVRVSIRSASEVLFGFFRILLNL